MSLVPQTQGCYERYSSQGYCVIVNNVLFGKRPARHGSDKDAENIKDEFETLGFKVLMENNLTKKETLSLMKKVSGRDHSKRSSLFVFLLSHGEMGTIYSTNDEEIQIREIISVFADKACPTLAGKPKVFIVQACRNLTENPAPSAPLGKDCLVAYATVVGEEAYRDSFEGSWYIQEFLKVVRDHSTEDDLVTMLSSVQGNLCTVYSVQCPEFQSSLGKKLYIHQLQSQRSSTVATSSLVFPVFQRKPSTRSFVSTTRSISSPSESKSVMVVDTNLLPKQFMQELNPSNPGSVLPTNYENFAVSQDIKTREQYSIESVPCGYCVLIDNSSGVSTGGMPDEIPLASDIHKFADQFRYQFGFHIEKYYNLSAEAILLLLKAVSEIDHSRMNCFTLIILSCGKTRDIYGADGEAVSVNKALDFFSDTNCPTLVQKPKLFMFQTTLEQNRAQQQDERQYRTPSDSFLLLNTPKQDENSQVLCKIAESFQENHYASVASLLGAHEQNGVCDVICKPTFKQCLKYPPLEPPQEGSDLDRRMSLDIRDNIIKALKQELTRHNDKLIKSTRRARVARIIGSSLSLVGGAVSLAGLILIPFTFGGSIALVAVGTSVGTAGAATSIGATVAKRKKRKRRLMKVQRSIEDCVQLAGSSIPGGTDHLQEKENTVHVLENGVKGIALVSSGAAISSIGTLHQSALNGTLALQVGGIILTGISVGGAIFGGVSLVISGTLSVAEIGHNIKYFKRGSKASRWLQDNMIQRLEQELSQHAQETDYVPYSLEETQSEEYCTDV